MLLHRTLAWVWYRYRWVNELVKGKVNLLAEHGQAGHKQLRKLNLNELDMLEGLHGNAT